jgi:hypothetical protein
MDEQGRASRYTIRRRRHRWCGRDLAADPGCATHFHHLPVSFSSPTCLFFCTILLAEAHACSLSVLKGTRWM